MLSVADECIPIRKSPTCKNISSPPWWDKDCTAAIRNRKIAEKAYSSAMTVENYLHYKKVAAETVSLLRLKKKEGWTKFCTSLSPRSSPSLIWKNIRKFRGSYSDTYENFSSSDPDAWLVPFSRKIAPLSAPTLEEVRNLPGSPSFSSNPLEAPFSWEEISLALSGLEDSAPGADGIPYSFITKSGNETKLHFLKMVNAIFESGTPPEEWKTQIIIPILKSGKQGNDPSSYRPIALSNTLFKVVERLIKNRLEWFLENNNKLSETQFGFRKGLSTMDSLGSFVTDIRVALSKRRSVVGVFLDIASAYDNVLLPVLRQKMLKLNIPEKFVNFICNTLNDRSVSVSFQNLNLPPRKIWKGLPQGSVLSPLLYSIYTHDLDLTVTSFCNVLQYADDLALYIDVDNILDASSRLNSAIYYLNNWLSDHGLSLSIPKSSVVVFSRARYIPHINISCEGQVFPNHDKVKFLGMVLDCRLTGVPHINYIVKKCERNLNIIRALSGVWWGAHPSTQKMMFNALVRSLLDYGSFLLEPCSKIALKLFDKIQSKCLRIILGAMKSSPINAMQWPDWLTIYTDASKLTDDSHVGSAVWVPKYNIILDFKCSQ
ncbi:unnamed protein product [Chilo suppressalis]|uniref:Reverse transcriptase domain-containing protein n=1 Tax=Chilo suppressalis TaxID=168631 RepID=A0ABN8BFG4_CHISP|nr:unnamed protein product [Chilo suppressalis]